MSLLYKEPNDVVYDVQVSMESKDTVNILISADCGKFGADEILCEETINVSSLMEFLNGRTNHESN
jgi:hypothetical protein